jgi:hypothetical protein
MALSPGARGQFFALNNDEILKFDANGARLAKFPAPAKSTRIATDRTGAVPYLMVVSSSTKWTGAIDYVVTTDYFLQALDATGREIWQKRFDPKEISTPEPLIASFKGKPVIVLSASRRIICFDVNGNELWNAPLWHHPGTVTEADLSADGGGALLAALAPKREIFRIGTDGRVLEPWGMVTRRVGSGPWRRMANSMVFRCVKYSDAARVSDRLWRSLTAKEQSFVKLNFRRTLRYQPIRQSLP